jgi:hypothetical protein
LRVGVRGARVREARGARERRRRREAAGEHGGREPPRTSPFAHLHASSTHVQPADRTTTIRYVFTLGW